MQLNLLWSIIIISLWTEIYIKYFIMRTILYCSQITTCLKFFTLQLLLRQKTAVRLVHKNTRNDDELWRTAKQIRINFKQIIHNRKTWVLGERKYFSFTMFEHVINQQWQYIYNHIGRKCCTSACKAENSYNI